MVRDVGLLGEPPAAHAEGAAGEADARAGGHDRDVEQAVAGSVPPISLPPPNAPVAPTTTCQARPSQQSASSQRTLQRSGFAVAAALIAPTA